MIETKHVGVKTKTVERVVAIAVLHISADGMPHISGVHAYLVLSSCLKFEFHQTVLCRAFERVIMSDCVFSSISTGEENVT